MNLDIFHLESVQIVENASDWQEAIRISVAPLVEQGHVKACYSDEIIANTEEYGAYYIIAPGVAMPHARPEQGVIDTQIGLTLFRNPVYFQGKEEGVQLFIVLAAADNEKHIDGMTMIVTALEDEDKIQALCSAENEKQLYEIFRGGNES